MNFDSFNFHPQIEVPASRIERLAIVISERPPEAPWERQGALLRNRITAALSEKLFIAEAQAENGALHTFRLARRLGVPCFAAAYTSDTPAGNAIAVREGAIPIQSTGQLLKAVMSPRPPQLETQRTFDWHDQPEG